MIVSDIRSFECEITQKELIESSEERFLSQMRVAVEETAKRMGKIIFLSGPSCSGKTTSGRILCEEFEKRGKKVKEISIDDFFYGRKEVERIARQTGNPIDIESAAAIDLEYLMECGERIKNQESVMLPKFDFKTASRSGYEKWTPEEDSIVLFEGIQAIYPEVKQIFKDMECTSLYIYPETSVKACDEVFTSDELRLYRRLVRDERSRNSPPEKTFMLWEGVRANEEKNIFPYVSGVDIKIDSSFAYEPYMIKDALIGLMEGVEKDSIYKDKADKIIQKFKSLPSLTDKYLPETSLFREFIGR